RRRAALFSLLRCPSYDFRAAALPPLRPAAFFWAVVPPCFEFEREDEFDPDFLPPRLEEPGELEIRAARSLDIPFSFSFSYCFSFLTLARLFGMRAPFRTSARTGLAAWPGPQTRLGDRESGLRRVNRDQRLGELMLTGDDLAPVALELARLGTGGA